MTFSTEDYRLMARTFRLRAADETSTDEITRLVEAARKYERLAIDVAPPPPRSLRPGIRVSRFVG
jgi:hypothetical protein